MQPSIWFEGGKYKCWYNMFSTCQPANAKSCGAPKNARACDSNLGYDAKSRTGSLAYAESVDGLKFTRPNLGLVPFGKIPAARTNIVLGDATSAMQPLSGKYPTGNGITLDESADPQHRWKMLGAKGMFSAYLATSADGLHWSNATEMVPGRYDTALNVLYDQKNQRWLAFARQQNTRVKSKMHRTLRYQSVATSINSNFLGKWGPMLPTLLNTSMGYQPDALVSFAYEGIFLGFANVIAFENVSTLNGVSQAGTVNAELVYSIDGQRWEYLMPGKSFIPLGGTGAWDSCSVFGAKMGFSSSQQPFAKNGSLNVYYAGCSGPFMGPRACSLGLATIQRDGWAGLQGQRGGGWVQLAPMHIFRAQLRLSVQSNGTRGVRLAISGSPSCSFNHSKPLVGSLPQALAEWSSDCDLNDYVGGAAVVELLIPEAATVFSVQG
eukprot:SAG31_NODE_960_length_10753_cov_7.843064_7_plen_437_part_00